MNTDQAFDMLKNAGVSDDASIEIVRRWLRERKIKYNGKVGQLNTGSILDNTDQAIQLLRDAGVDSRKGMEVLQRWLQAGKIHKVGNKNQLKEYLTNDTKSSRFINMSSEQDKTIRDLKAKIKGQDHHIRGLEELHKESVKSLIQQREKLHKEILNLEHERNHLQKEMTKLLKDNLEIRKELLELRGELSKDGTRKRVAAQTIPPGSIFEYQQKLGLSKTAGEKEVLAGFKKLLKITHPDHGGNATVFHYVKSDYDQYKNDLKK